MNIKYKKMETIVSKNKVQIRRRIVLGSIVILVLGGLLFLFESYAANKMISTGEQNYKELIIAASIFMCLILLPMLSLIYRNNGSKSAHISRSRLTSKNRNYGKRNRRAKQHLIKI